MVVMVAGADSDQSLDGAAAAIAALPADAEQISDSQLAVRLAELVRLRAMLDAHLVAHVAAFDRRDAARYDGQTSTQAWLSARLRLGTDANKLVAAARQLPGLHQTAKAIAAGELTLEHAAAIGRLAARVGVDIAAEHESTLVDLARQASPPLLQRACEHLRQLLDTAAAEADSVRAYQRRYLAAARTTGGMVHLQGLFDPASGDVVLAALRAAMPVPAVHDSRSGAQRRADALVDVCAGWLASGAAPVSGGIRPQVQVTVSLDALRDRTRLATPAGASRSASEVAEPGRMHGEVPLLADHSCIPPSVARTIACDAGVIPIVLGSASEVVEIGRQSRVVPVGLRRLLNLRDGGCRFPGCDRPAQWCDAHHIRHWADGGATNPANCVLLCAYHHGRVHQGWRIHGDPNGTLRFHRPDRTRLDLTSAPRGPTPAT